MIWYVIRVYPVVTGGNGGPRAPQWIRAYDVDAEQGHGTVALTEERAQALHFASASEALVAWHTQSRVRPWRDDGRANRPLTAYTVEIEPAP